jgi:gas vesicle protein
VSSLFFPFYIGRRRPIPLLPILKRGGTIEISGLFSSLSTSERETIINITAVFIKEDSVMATMKDFQGGYPYEGREEGSSYTTGMLIGLLAGGALGAALALLFAPKSGRELRYDLSEMATTYGDKAGEMMHGASDKAKQAVNDGRVRAEGIVTDARAKASEILSDAERIVTDARAKAQGGATRTADDVKDRAHKIADAAKAGVKAFSEELRSDNPAASDGAKSGGGQQHGPSHHTGDEHHHGAGKNTGTHGNQG